jgi:hypothetical protein
LADPNIIATTVSAVGILVGVYSIVNRSEDRMNRKVDQRFDAMEKLFTEKLMRVEQVMDARIKHLENHD